MPKIVKIRLVLFAEDCRSIFFSGHGVYVYLCLIRARFLPV